MMRVGILRQLCAALVVAIGVAIVWGTIVIWGASVVDGLLRSQEFVYESLIVTRTGTPLVEARSSRDYQDVSYRTLDGKPVEVNQDDRLTAASLPEPAEPPRLLEPRARWGEALSASDFRRPAAGWYLIRNTEPHGRAYFLGFDERSKLPIGYIGRNGFRRSLPPPGDWFDLGFNRLQWGSGVATSTGYLTVNSPANQYTQFADAEGIANWLVFLIDAGTRPGGSRLLEIDLRNRTVRTVQESPGLISVGVLTEANAPSASDDKPQSSDAKTITRLALRSLDRITLIDPAADERREFALPEAIRSKQHLNIYSLASGQLLVEWYPRNTERRETRLMWLGKEGQIVREETLLLAYYSDPFSPRSQAAMITGVVPIPLGWLLGTGVVAPLGAVLSNSEPTYAAALAKVLDVCWPALLIVLGVGCTSAWLVSRWQRTYHRASTGVWCAFAFLLGLPALVAYWLEHRPAKLESCNECGNFVPRDRNDCAACATPFPAPPLVGTEIFA